ncbi:zinc finger protein 25-like [Folsomia candida]|nr:zinc finger protein 25-like [Folsomia candida]
MEHAENPVRFRCTLCAREFKRREYLNLHITTNHTGEKAYKCSTCEKRFVQRSHLQIHRRVHTDKSDRIKFICHHCDRVFLTKPSLTGHIRAAHENLRNYGCPHCDKKFYRSAHLKGHVESKHTISKDPATNARIPRSACEIEPCRWKECYFCGKRSLRYFNLARHVRRHTSEV